MRILRNKDPEAIHLLTNRTEQAELLMIPTPEAVDIIGGVIGRYQKLHRVEIYELKILSNHYHMLASQPDGEIWKFMTDVNREIAKRINKLNNREGRFWGGRYKDQVVLEESDQLKAYAYIKTNATHHSLVEKPEDWPGLSSYNCQGKGFPFLNNSAYFFAKLRDKNTLKEDFTSYYNIEISELPCLKKFSANECKTLKSTQVRERLEEIYEKNQKGFLGVERLLSQAFGAKPKNVKKSSKGAFYSGSALAIRAARELYKELCSAYKEASERFRLGELEVEFPDFTFKPPLHYYPKVAA